MLALAFAMLRRAAPRVHNITNYVSANDVANLLLAVGAKPIMADAPEEVGEVSAHCDALCLNLGIPNPRKRTAMLLAGQAAAAAHHPIVFDPVGVGASAFRQEIASELLSTLPITAIRGNVSELRTLANGGQHNGGVDVLPQDAVTEENLPQAIQFAKSFAAAQHTLVVLSGAIDLVADADRCYVIRNGVPQLGEVTGTGCQLSALLAAVLAANPAEPLEAAAAAVAGMGLAGEIALCHLLPHEGNATYRSRILDALYHLDDITIQKGANYEIR